MRRAIVSVFICSSFLRAQICAKPLQPRGERAIEDQIAALYTDAGDERLILDDLQPDAASDMALDQRMDLRALIIAEHSSREHLGRDDIGSVCLMQLQHFSQLRAQRLISFRMATVCGCASSANPSSSRRAFLEGESSGWESKAR